MQQKLTNSCLIFKLHPFLQEFTKTFRIDYLNSVFLL